jgi:membrane protease YdiL (CAAX protease family)
MSDPEHVRSPISVSVRPPRIWDFMETLFVALLADGAFKLTSGLALTVMLITHEGVGSLSPAELRSLWMQGNWLGVALVVGCPPAIAVVWIAVRKAGWDFAEYLALNWPSAGEIVRAFVIMAFLLAVELVTISFAGADFGTGHYLVVKDAGGLFILLIGGCVVAPIAEEFVVRGFMFRGWSESFAGPIGAIVLTSALWALNHTQYDWFGRFWVFVTGLALGYFRWRSNSTWLTVMVHSAINTFFFFVAGPYT